MREVFTLYLRRTLIILGSIALIVLLLYIFRTPILRYVGNRLTAVDEPQVCDAIFVLSGQANERGKASAKLLKQKIAPVIYCTGSLTPALTELLEKPMTEAQLTGLKLEQEGVKSDKIKYLKIGTSTWEECQAILRFAQEKSMKRIIILSSNFHTRRIRSVIESINLDGSLQVLICGAPALTFDEQNWWQSEEGLIAINNEYMKALYYWLKY